MSSYGNITKSYVSAVDPVIDTREINKNVADVANQDYLTDILNWGDRKKVIPTGQPIYYTFVNESVFKKVTVNSVTSGSGGTSLILVLTAATSGQTKVQDLLKFTDNNVGIVYAVSTSSGIDTITVKSVSGANITCTGADKLAVFSVAMGERSDAPANERFGLTRYSNRYQIFSVTSEITDVQNAATVEVDFEGQPKWVVKDHIEKKLKLKGVVNAAMIGGDISNTSFSDTNPYLVDQNIVTGGGGGGAVQTTRGVDKYIELYGTALNTGGGAYTAGAIDDVLDNLTSQKAPTDYLVVGGKKSRRKVDTFWKNLGSSGVTSVRLMFDGKEIDMTVDKVTYGGYDLNHMTMPLLDNPDMFSEVVISKSLYFLPYNASVRVLGGGFEPAMSVRYVPAQNLYGSEMIGETHSGALSPINPNGTVQEWKTIWTTKQGMEVLAPSFFLRQQVS